MHNDRVGDQGGQIFVEFVFLEPLGPCTLAFKIQTSECASKMSSSGSNNSHSAATTPSPASPRRWLAKSKSSPARRQYGRSGPGRRDSPGFTFSAASDRETQDSDDDLLGKTGDRPTARSPSPESTAADSGIDQSDVAREAEIDSKPNADIRVPLGRGATTKESEEQPLSAAKSPASTKSTQDESSDESDEFDDQPHDSQDSQQSQTRITLGIYGRNAHRGGGGRDRRRFDSTMGRSKRRVDARAVQGVGNCKMIVDELSYLCSTIIHNRRDVILRPGTTVKQHNSATADAACDIADLVSKSDSRQLVMMIGAEAPRGRAASSGDGAVRVGALDALLEAVACAPHPREYGDVCSHIIHGRTPTGLLGRVAIENKAQMSDLDFDGAFDNRSNHRREFSTGEISTGGGSIGGSERDISVNGLEQEYERSSYDDVSSKALSAVSYFISVDCAGTNKAADSVRKRVLRHRTALQGLARLITDDSIVHDFLREAADTVSLSQSSNCDNSSIASSVMQSQSSSVDTRERRTSDPTKRGRRRGHKRNRQSGDFKRKKSFKRHSFDSSAALKLHSDQQTPHNDLSVLDFRSNEKKTPTPQQELVIEPDVSKGDKFNGKIERALSRARLVDFDGMLLPPRSGDAASSREEAISRSALSFYYRQRNENVSICASTLALIAAKSVITGRDEAATQQSPMKTDDESMGNSPVPDNFSLNPIVYANDMLRRSGSLSQYGRSMAETIAALVFQARQSRNKSSVCTRCLGHLLQRASLLSEVIDSLCCLSPEVSASLCIQELLLIPSLLRVIADLSFGRSSLSVNASHAMIITALKTLSSMTHENLKACDQIVDTYDWKVTCLPVSCRKDANCNGGATKKISGLDILFSHLYKTVASGGELDSIENKADYDSAIYCLTILSNVVEMSPNRSKGIFEKMVVSETSAISWLAQWVVSRTSGFKRSVMQASFGSQDASHADEDVGLKEGEEDNLLAAGNGFVLLASLMIDESNSFPVSSIRSSIIDELPQHRIQFMINTLKAFCNFYHYSVGDLSVAVIFPVKKLISGLELLDQDQGTEEEDDQSTF